MTKPSPKTPARKPAKTKPPRASLTLGPVLFHWGTDTWRDFYARIADEAPVDTVVIGEVVCAKRAPFYEALYEDVAERLIRGGKQVMFATVAEAVVALDRRAVKSVCDLDGVMIEANDATALSFLKGRPHAVGSYVNVYNEDTLALLAARGATRFCLPPELPATAIAALVPHAQKLGVTLEVQVYGRLSLALSGRCYHARAQGRTKDNCQFACADDADGMVLSTIDDKPFLAVNGIQTLSHACLNLARELAPLAAMGINAFRLSPHDHDMVKVAQIFRATADGKTPPAEAIEALSALTPMPFANGFHHAVPGAVWT